VVTPQALESPSSVLHFKIDNPSPLFDMKQVVLGCQVLKIDTGPASKEVPVQFITPTETAHGRVLSEKKFFVIPYRGPVSFDCGAESVFQMERSGVAYFPPRIEMEILIQYQTLGIQRQVAKAGPFVAVRNGGKYQWTEGTPIKAETVGR
jgi:hypothetical protein